MNDPSIRPDPAYRMLSSRDLCQGAVVGVRRERIHLPNGHEMEQDVICLPDAVAVVPLVEGERGDFRVVLVEQFRNSVRGHMHEIPAGIVDPGEAPADCARRELEEETGYRAGRLTHLASLLMIPGTSGHRLHFFLAESLDPGRQRLEPAECLRTRSLPFWDLARDLVESPPGTTEVVDAKTHLGLLHAAAVLRARPGGAE